jgi:hypothetical protein
MSGFSSLEEVAGYLNACRARKLRTDDWSFEAHSIPDRSAAVCSFFRDNPQHRVSVNAARRFTTLSERALACINETLPEGMRVNPQNPVLMANKYS